MSALTTAIWLPPAAAKTGGASPTLPTSIEPAPMACSIGGPEVKSDQCALNGSLPIRPAAVSSACAPEPGLVADVQRDVRRRWPCWPTLVPLAAGLLLAAEPEPDEEHAERRGPAGPA